jgi:hypothetical protein
MNNIVRNVVMACGNSQAQELSERLRILDER